MHPEMPNEKENILLIAPTYFYFAEAIKVEMERRGYSVIAYSDRPSNNKFIKSLIRINRKLAVPTTSAYITKILASVSSLELSKVIVILGQAFTPKMIQRLKNAHQEAEFVYYIWDPVEHHPYSPKLFDLFDRAYTFEKKDLVRSPKLQFINNFFVDDYRELSHQRVPQKYKYSYIGTAYPTKVDGITKLREHLPDHLGDSFLYLYLPSKNLRRVFSCKNKGYSKGLSSIGIHYQPLPKQEVLKVFNETEIILDFPREAQEGLTMRTLDCQAAKKKLITTNPDIVNYDFYNPQNIYYFDGEHIDLDNVFFKEKDFVPVPEEILEKYSIRSFVSILLGGN